MLYEIVGIARASKQAEPECKDILRSLGRLIINNRGVIRTIENWGVKPLPSIKRKHGETYVYANYFYLKFDASPGVQSQISRNLRLDRRMIQSTVVKVGGNSLKSLISENEETFTRSFRY